MRRKPFSFLERVLIVGLVFLLVLFVQDGLGWFQPPFTLPKRFLAIKFSSTIRDLFGTFLIPGIAAAIAAFVLAPKKTASEKPSASFRVTRWLRSEHSSSAFHPSSSYLPSTLRSRLLSARQATALHSQPSHWPWDSSPQSTATPDLDEE